MKLQHLLASALGLAFLAPAAPALADAYAGPPGGYAQPPPNYVPPPPGYPPPPPNAQAVDPEMAYRWAIGLQASGITVQSSANPDDKIDLSGGGIDLRYRLNRRFSLQLGASKLTGDLDNYGTLHRESQSLTFGALLHLTPGSEWNWYLSVGFGGTHDDVTFLDSRGASNQAQFQESHFELGGGIERRYEHLGVGLELRAVGLQRQDDQLDGPAYRGIDGGPIPHESSGGLVSLHAAYYF